MTASGFISDLLRQAVPCPHGPAPSVRRSRSAFLTGLAAWAVGVATSGLAQTPPENVHWTAAIASDGSLTAGAAATLELHATIDDGWHVYGLMQLPGGPVPLRVQLDANEFAGPAGEAVESRAEKIHDPRFGLETQFHTHAAEVRLPVRLSQQDTGHLTIPVSVRFQLCSDRECQPPRTIHLSVPLDVPAHG